MTRAANVAFAGEEEKRGDSTAAVNVRMRHAHRSLAELRESDENLAHLREVERIRSLLHCRMVCCISFIQLRSFLLACWWWSAAHSPLFTRPQLPHRAESASSSKLTGRGESNVNACAHSICLILRYRRRVASALSLTTPWKDAAGTGMVYAETAVERAAGYGPHQTAQYGHHFQSLNWATFSAAKKQLEPTRWPAKRCYSCFVAVVTERNTGWKPCATEI
jgi:hypothetical protein